MGTCEKISKIYKEKYFKKLNIFCVPENLRLGKSIEIFLNPDRVIIGHDNDLKKSEVQFLIEKLPIIKFGFQINRQKWLNIQLIRF